MVTELMIWKYGNSKMKRTLYYSLLMLVILVLGTVGCQKSEDGNTQSWEYRLAPVEEVRIIFSDSDPPLVSAYIKIGLADSCTSFHGIEMTRDGTTLNIEVKTRRKKDAQCAQVYSFYERTIRLGSDFTPGETYTAKVNDKTTTFTMQ